MRESCALRLGIEALRPAPRCIYAGAYRKMARDPWTSGSWPRHGQGGWRGLAISVRLTTEPAPIPRRLECLRFRVPRL